jgi:hypothetical protein
LNVPSTSKHAPLAPSPVPPPKTSPGVNVASVDESTLGVVHAPATHVSPSLHCASTGDDAGILSRQSQSRRIGSVNCPALGSVVTASRTMRSFAPCFASKRTVTRGCPLVRLITENVAGKRTGASPTPPRGHVYGRSWITVSSRFTIIRSASKSTPGVMFVLSATVSCPGVAPCSAEQPAARATPNPSGTARRTKSAEP